MRKNYIPYTFYFSLIIIGILGLLSLIDDYGFTKLKPVSIFSDIISPKTTTDTVATIEIILPTVHEESFPCPSHIQCFEHYTESPYPLDTLICKLLSKTEQVRVAWFGDSFCEADIVVGDLRDTLQSLYGGSGVGFMPITYEAAGFRRTVIHRFNGWRTRSFITHPQSSDLGIGGTAHKPDTNAYVIYEGTSKFYKNTQNFSTVRLFYTSEKESFLTIRLNGDNSQTCNIEKTQLPETVVVSAPDIRRVAVSVPNSNRNLTMYGVSLEDETGIYFDNFSIKGNSGFSLLSVREDILKRFNDLLHYDLIVLQFGLNVAEQKRTDYTTYAQRMTNVIERLRDAFPEVPILIMSISDRSYRQQGEYTTMPGVLALLETQRKLAIDNQTLFWNLFEAMGGINSMPTFVNAKPPLANKDYTHLNHAGSRKIGLLFAESFIHEITVYKKRKKDQQ